MAASHTGTARSWLGTANHPIFPALLPVVIVCFVGVLATDAVYVGNPDMMWIDFSSWLLLAGLVFGGLAGVVLIIDMVRLGGERRRALLPHFVLLFAAWVVEVFNSFVHARDGWTAVVPAGITLSAIAAILALSTGWVWQAARNTVVGGVR